MDFLANMDYLTIVNIAYLSVIGIFVFFGIITGLIRGTIKSFSRLVCLCASALFAMLATSIVINQYGTQIAEYVLSLDFVKGAMENLGEMTEASPTLTTYAPILAMCAVAPIAFVLAFIVFALLTLPIGAIFNWILKGVFAEKKNGLSRLLGMLLSICCGVVISGCFLMPVTGYLVNAGAVYEKLEQENVVEPNNEEGQKIADALKGVDELMVVKFENKITGFVFKSTTSYRMPSGVQGDLVGDANAVLNVVPSVMNLSAMDFSDIENIDLSPLRGILEGIRDNESIRAIAAEILSYASGKWLNNEPFMDLNIKEELPEDFEDIKDAFDPVLEKLNATTKDTVIDDLIEFIDEIEALSKAYPAVKEMSEANFSSIEDVDVTPFETIVDAIEQTTIVKEIVANIISTAGGKWLCGQSFMELNIEEQLPDDFKGVLTPAYETFASTDKDKVVDDLRSFIALFGDLKAIVGEATALSEQSFAEGDLDSIDVTPLNNMAIRTDEATSPLTKPIIASIMARAGSRWLDGQTFLGINIEEQLPDDLKDVLTPAYAMFAATTADSVVNDFGSFVSLLCDVRDIMSEINALAAQSFDEDNLQDVTEEPIRNMATITEQSTSTLTKPIIATIVARAGTKWYNSEPFLGINIKEQLPAEYKNSFDAVLTILKDTTEDTVVGDLNNFADCIASVVNTYRYFKELSSGTANLGDMADALSDALSTVTDENKDVIAEVMNDAINNIVDDEETAEVISGIVTNALDRIAEENANSDGGVSEEVRNYAEAVNSIVNYVTGENDEQVTADDIIETVTNSNTLSGVIIDYTETEGAATIPATDEQKEAISSAIDGYEESNEETLTDEQRQTLEALKKLFGIT